MPTNALAQAGEVLCVAAFFDDIKGLCSSARVMLHRAPDE
jgi:hypothetical protein